jgi:hypothetical protein
MIQTVTLHDFISAFKNSGLDNQFSREALELIFNYYEALGDDTGEPIELDVIAICCDWREECPHHVNSNYEFGVDDPKEFIEEVIDNLSFCTPYAGKTSEGMLVYVGY